MITELDFATVSLKLNTAEKETREDIVASYTGDLNEFLELCLVSLSVSCDDADEQHRISRRRSRSRMRRAAAATRCASAASTFPFRWCSTRASRSTVRPSSSCTSPDGATDSGIIRVDLLDAKDLPSADRSGKSDPCMSSASGSAPLTIHSRHF